MERRKIEKTVEIIIKNEMPRATKKNLYIKKKNSRKKRLDSTIDSIVLQIGITCFRV